ncbi:proteinral secretion pathway protein GspL [Pseudomonas cannabina pv. alisalensis]|uniref:Proteinral secretion pathway protein GspL n=1 Tax=Pseudomonas cannabina TaxID=86840 RepID=A0A3M3RA96_PSECA|nr:type II secretion system protein GspL [Pseudomonas cannabina]KPW21342.1 proteinral secretion pathway protein GspL [Pseudomonas cannabina pv. alisalensis]RMN77914.1 proteinral secretion pathway protein GspL [Pseudomonas cannabina]RMN88083.1 proteinral secretion pathway protein GspL [Pseudomonas cannabina pv. alisalensis]RMN93399.1 proteinral secretion pathway protein GspL [Pseudomonas cannabina]
MNRLRIALPPLHTLTLNSELTFARLDRRNHLIESGRSSLQHLCEGFDKQSVEAFLHPLDSLLADIELAPLSALHTKAAAVLAAQGLVLGDTEQVHIACSARQLDGRVQIGWLPKADLRRLMELLNPRHFSLHGLFPAPYALPVPAAGHVSVCLVDEHWLLRYSAASATVQPRLAEDLDEPLTRGLEPAWPGEGDSCLSGASPGWSLHGGMASVARSKGNRVGALACCALAVGVWVAGLNLYAAREAEQGQQLKARMTQRVQQAFPQLPIILNPLQQARQQVAALTGAKEAGTVAGFNGLMVHAAQALPFLIGSVQSLTFSEGKLQVQLLADMPSPAGEGAWQVALAQAGLAVSRDERAWTISPLIEPPSDDGSVTQGRDDD